MLRKIYLKKQFFKVLILNIRVERKKEREQIMSMSCYQLNIFAMQSRINKVNKQLTAISDKRTNVTMQMNQIIQQYQGNYDTDLTATENSKNWSEDPKVILLQNQDNRFDMEQKSIETELNALTQALENLEKAQETCVKNGVAKLA